MQPTYLLKWKQNKGFSNSKSLVNSLPVGWHYKNFWSPQAKVSDGNLDQHKGMIIYGVYVKDILSTLKTSLKGNWLFKATIIMYYAIDNIFRNKMFNKAQRP